MINGMRDILGYYICNFAFLFDRLFLRNLPMDESKWTFYHKVGYSIFCFIYKTGIKIYS